MIINGNALQIPLADKSVQCCITSPPYWSLRDYGVDGQLGLEPTPEQYVDNMVRVFRDVRRVLRDDGVLWLNLGDSYMSSGIRQTGRNDEGPITNRRGGSIRGGRRTKINIQRVATTAYPLKPKDLVGIPWRVAFALQADGWWLRSDIIWHKPNCMPESATDRPTKAHEYVFLLSKSAKYYYDADAIREPHATIDNRFGGDGSHYGSGVRYHDGVKNIDGGVQRGVWMGQHPSGRNRRTVWTIPTHPYSGAHFATFPPKLVEPMILAGTSARGECPVCGLGWRRVVERKIENREGWGASNPDHATPHGTHGPSMRGDGRCGDSVVITTGWQPQCTHNTEPIPQLVLDPFGGTCTVGQVAIKHRRRFAGLELNGDYIELARKRTSGVQVALL